MKRISHAGLICVTAIALILPILLGALYGLLISSQTPAAEPVQTDPVPSRLTLSDGSIDFNIGSTRTLTASMADASGSYIFQWNTSDKNIVSVKKDAEAQDVCQLTAEGAGSATVTASIIDITKFKVVESISCVVTVSDEQIDFGIEEVIISLSEDNTAEVHASAPGGGEILWTSADDTIATVKDGIITAHQAGSVQIIARSGNVESRLPVRIYNSFFALEELIIINAGTSDTIAIDGSISGNGLWISGDDRVATVDTHGTVTGVAAGMTTVTATSEADGLTSTCVVIVRDGSTKPINLNVGSKSTAANNPGTWFYLCESENVALKRKPTFAGGVISAEITAIGDSGSNFFYLRYQPDDTGDVIYRHTVYIYSDTNLVPIQINGADYELKKGLNRIDLEYTSAEPKDGAPYQIKWKGTGQFYVLPVFEEVSRIAKLILSADAVNLNLTDNSHFTITAEVPTQDNPAITWTSSNEAVAVVSDGVVTAVGEGSTMITAVCADLTAKCLITVEGETPITGEPISKGNKTVALETPGQWFYLRDGKSTLYFDPILDSNNNLRLAIEKIDEANRKYVYLRYQPESQKDYTAVITIEFAGEDGTVVDILGGTANATPIVLHNGANTIEFSFTANDKTPFQFKFYSAGNYVIHVTFREE